jgi:hypothetical protein
MRWMSLASILAAAAAVYFVTQGESELKVHMLIATALGAGLSVLLGAALMSLAFHLSAPATTRKRIAPPTRPSPDKDDLDHQRSRASPSCG